MNLSATIAKMKACGMSAGAIVQALECIVLEEPKTATDRQAERRREADRERKAKARDAERLRKSAESADTPSPLVPPFPPAPPIPPIIPPTPAENFSAGASEAAESLETKLREAAGWQNEPHPGLFVTGPIEALIANGADLEADVLPVIRGRARSVRRPAGWNYFVGPIQDAVAARKAAATGPPLKLVNGSRPEPSKTLEELAKELLPGWTPGPKFASTA